MPVDLTKPLEWKKADAANSAMLADLQGNILKGHGREHTVNLFLKFDPAQASAVKTWIAGLAGYVTTARNQLNETAARRAHIEATGSADGFVSQHICLFFLSAAGYTALGVPAAQRPADNDAWGKGMKARTQLLADPPPAKWEPGLDGDIHAMLLLADTTEGGAAALAKVARASFPGSSITVVHEVAGKSWKNEHGDGIEHFGYVDGRSQPLMLREDVTNEHVNEDGTGVWDPEFPIGQALVEDPAGTPGVSYGSYFVFRKLEQNVKLFKAMEDDLAETLGMEGDAEELAGSMLVGRFEDGTPTLLQNAEGMHNPVPNNFDYRDDAAGTKCPFHSHIRKVNPRGASVTETANPAPGMNASLSGERSHIMARRGIPYGERRFTSTGDGVEFKDQPEAGVGLLFMAYQNNIANQFEFTQALWANNPNFPEPKTGLDPVIGQGGKGSQQCPVKWGGERDPQNFKPFDFAGAVTMKGGEYFFAPSISGLKSIGGETGSLPEPTLAIHKPRRR